MIRMFWPMRSADILDKRWESLHAILLRALCEVYIYLKIRQYVSKVGQPVSKSDITAHWLSWQHMSKLACNLVTDVLAVILCGVCLKIRQYVSKLDSLSQSQTPILIAVGHCYVGNLCANKKTHCLLLQAVDPWHSCAAALQGQRALPQPSLCSNPFGTEQSQISTQTVALKFACRQKVVFSRTVYVIPWQHEKHILRCRCQSTDCSSPTTFCLICNTWIQYAEDHIQQTLY